MGSVYVGKNYRGNILISFGDFELEEGVIVNATIEGKPQKDGKVEWSLHYPYITIMKTKAETKVDGSIFMEEKHNGQIENVKELANAILKAGGDEMKIREALKGAIEKEKEKIEWVYTKYSMHIGDEVFRYTKERWGDPTAERSQDNCSVYVYGADTELETVFQEALQGKRSISEVKAWWEENLTGKAVSVKIREESTGVPLYPLEVKVEDGKVYKREAVPAAPISEWVLQERCSPEHAGMIERMIEEAIRGKLPLSELEKKEGWIEYVIDPELYTPPYKYPHARKYRR